MSTLVAGGDPDELYHLGRVLGDAAEELRRMQARTQWGTAASRQPSEPAVIVARVRTWTAEQSVDVQRRARQLDNDRTHLYEWDDKPLLGMAAHGKRRLTLTDAKDQLRKASATSEDAGAGRAQQTKAGRVVNTEQKNTGGRPNRQLKDTKPKPSSASARKAQQLVRDVRRAAREVAEKVLDDTAVETFDDIEALRDAAEPARRAAEQAAREVVDNSNGQDVSRTRKAANEAAKEAAEKAVTEAKARAEQARVARKAAEAAEREQAMEMLRDNNEGLLGALAGAGAVATGVWWAGKALSPACGPLAPVCLVTL